jgi:hypothetical protein
VLASGKDAPAPANVAATPVTPAAPAPADKAAPAK